jgi:endonuclease/exonuclease/phosphatase family metal-dependent hydrolase
MGKLAERSEIGALGETRPTQVGTIMRIADVLWPRRGATRSGRKGLAFFRTALPLVFLLVAWLELKAAEPFTVGTYNLENYLEGPSGTRPGKSATAKAKVRESMKAMRADVLGLQEVGGTNALEELRASLKSEGLDYPFGELVSGADTNIQVAVLSRFPITARRPHSEEGFLLNGRRFRLTRGIVEVEIEVTPHYSFTLLVAHLKSRRPVPEADEADLREQEALVLRQRIDDCLRAKPNANLILVGDLNDVKDSRSTRAVIGKGKAALLDTRPAEENGDRSHSPNPRLAPRNITWTHFFGKEDTYSRFDYILLSQGMAREWQPNRTHIVALPNWGLASDHRPLVASFVAEER